MFPFALGYIVEKKKMGGDWEKVNTFPSAGEKMTVPDLEEGEQYEFRVAAQNKAGTGPFSPPSEAKRYSKWKGYILGEFELT